MTYLWYQPHSETIVREMEWINKLKQQMRPYFGSYCGAINCSTNQKYYSEISLFRFPKDPERSKKWLINTRRADLMKKDTLYLYNNIKICALHFEDNQFMNTEKKRLVWNAVPTLFDVPNKPPTLTVKRKLPTRCPVPVKKKQKVRHSVNGGVGSESNTAVCSEVTLKVEPQSAHEEISSQEHTPQVCDRVRVKVEPDAEYEGECRTQEPEFIEVKGEPLEAEEADDAGDALGDELPAW